MVKYGGWAGKVLRVDLSTGRIWTEDTVERYKDYLGGTGIGYKVMWDEVPAGAEPYGPENRVIFASGGDFGRFSMATTLSYQLSDHAEFANAVFSPAVRQ